MPGARLELNGAAVAKRRKFIALGYKLLSVPFYVSWCVENVAASSYDQHHVAPLLTFLAQTWCCLPIFSPFLFPQAVGAWQTTEPVSRSQKSRVGCDRQQERH